MRALLVIAIIAAGPVPALATSPTFAWKLTVIDSAEQPREFVFNPRGDLIPIDVPGWHCLYDGVRRKTSGEMTAEYGSVICRTGDSVGDSVAAISVTCGYVGGSVHKRDSYQDLHIARKGKQGLKQAVIVVECVASL